MTHPTRFIRSLARFGFPAGLVAGMTACRRRGALDVLDGQIQAIRFVINPDKLAHLGPVADAWVVAREVNQARRPTDDRTRSAPLS